ncbi:hypothetical protein [Amnibacterium kyonggiense]|uniref:Uncharacterized protein n=1 Tax=Amnibacterium kyonggiense TaxID=595671 RepID=A0A4R7FLB9_9MICO|nr:hypothetical protein [Amnibacterium kyonggiense]TDS77201.1 hypothetical protein CLV52_2142 [Amnibacterium kyonggiense]
MANGVGSIIRLAAKHGPKIGVAATAIGGFLAKNPEVSAWLKGRVETLPKQLDAIRKRRGDAAQIRGMLEIVRDVAGKLHAEGAAAAVASDWVRRADDVELGVQLAERLSPPAKKEAVSRLKTRAEALLAELIEATTAT